MKLRLALVVIPTLLLPGVGISAQQATSDAATPDASQIIAYWVAYWAKPKVVRFGPSEEELTATCTKSSSQQCLYAPENASALD